MLRLHDHRTGRAEALPGGRGLRVQVLTGTTGYRRAIVADLLRRVAERGGRRVRVCCAPAAADDLADYNVQPFEDASLPDPDVYVSGAADTDALCLVVPDETGDWAAPDAPAVRLAMLETPYREPLDLSPARVSSARERLDGWRRGVAGWATSPGRPMNREYAAEAEAALADDLGGPAALAVLDRLAADPDVPPGAKLETAIHLDLLLGLGLVAAIGTA
ncbi:hypothetical protein K8Z49_18535 [Actinomadura madurae]|uniref:hypothetical protein n=1 Tax=Actinomadura madurae TaxID=1993 RepID=UPI00399AA901